MKYLILDYLEATASRLPEKTAFADEHTNVTFGQLVHRARAVGSALLPLVSPRSVVGFYMDKSVHTVTGFMGAVYAGCAYAQLNLRHPPARIRCHSGYACNARRGDGQGARSRPEADGLFRAHSAPGGASFLGGG